MRRSHIPAAILALSLVWLPSPEASGQAGVSSSIVPPMASLVRGPFELDPDDFKTSSANINLEVTSPQKALATVERLIKKMGGEIQSSSGNVDSASLSARLGERRLQSVVDAIRAIPGKVVNVNRNTSDYSQNARQSINRLERLVHAQGELVRAFKTAPNADAVDGLMMLRGLVDTERTNLENQIESLRQESVRAQLHVRFDRLK